jgi:CRP-like cAMP-binding protein
MNAFENRNATAGKGERTSYRLEQEGTSGAPLMMEEGTGIRRGYTSPKPIPFNGLLTNKLLAALPGPDFARLLPRLEPVSLISGQDVYKFGEAIDFAYFPETVVISQIYFLEDGSTTGAAIVGREGMTGLSAIFDSRPPTYWTRITIAGSALRVEQEVIKREFARGEAMQKLLLGYTSTRLAQLSQRAVCNGRHNLEGRLCTWLLMIHDRASEQQLPLTHEEIAHHLGARRAGVTSSCNVLRDNGIIHYRRGLIRILDREKLESVACECYRMLRQTVERPQARK